VEQKVLSRLMSPYKVSTSRLAWRSARPARTPLPRNGVAVDTCLVLNDPGAIASRAVFKRITP